MFSFDSAGSHDADDGDRLSYSWSFDDGASASGATASHAFSTPGQHEATLTVSDSSGVTSTATATVTVTAPVTGVTLGPAGSGSPTGVAGSIGNGPGTGPGGGTHGRPAPARGKVTIRISRLRIHGTSITFRLSCGRAARCLAVNLTVTTAAHHHSIKIGALRLNLRRGQTETVTLNLNRGGRALLASARKLAITITAHLGGTAATGAPRLPTPP